MPMRRGELYGFIRLYLDAPRSPRPWGAWSVQIKPYKAVQLSPAHGHAYISCVLR